MVDNKRATRQSRDHEALRMHLSGCSYAEIAREMAFASKSSAHAAVRRALDDREIAVPTARGSKGRDVDLRTDIARLDALLQAHWDAARSGDGAATDRVMKILTARRALADEYAAAPPSAPTPPRESGIATPPKNPEVPSIADIRAQRAARLATAEGAAPS